MPFMDILSGDRSRSTAEMFVCAPHSEIHTPFLQLVRHGSYGVAQVKSDDDSFIMGSLRDFLHLQHLTAPVENGWQQYERDAFIHHIDDCFSIKKMSVF